MKTLALAPDRRERLIAALDQLGSDIPEERAAAGLEATIALRAVGLEWDRLIITAAAPVRTPHQSPPVGPAWREDLTLCRHQVGKLRAWEQAFVADLNGVSIPTAKQATVLTEVAAGLRARGLGEDAASRPPVRLRTI